MFDQIERLKTEYTDRYVVVDATQPELARFRGMTGQVKTVNMSGRALVQFDAYNNIGWYDIHPTFLTVVPKPEPKAEEKPKPKAEKPQTSADHPAVAPKPAAPTKPAGEKKMSVAEMLRAAKSGGAAKPAESAAPQESTKFEHTTAAAPAAGGEAAAVEKVSEPAAETKPPAPQPAGEKKKLSTAEILAALKQKP